MSNGIYKVIPNDFKDTETSLIMAKKLGLGTRDHMTWDLDKIDNEWIAMIAKTEPSWRNMPTL